MVGALNASLVTIRFPLHLASEVDLAPHFISAHRPSSLSQKGKVMFSFNKAT